MNLTDLKQDFYKRFNVSSAFLSYSRMGLLCPLLGEVSIERCPSLACSLSMKVQVYARRLEGDMIKLQSTKNNLCVIFRFGGRLPSQHPSLFEMLDKMHGYGVGGAEIFFDSSIPQFFGCERELKAAVFDVMQKIYNVSVPVSVCGGFSSPYSALLDLRKGYCISEPEGNRLPLPLTGCKLLIVQTAKTDKTPRARYIEKAYMRLKRIYPHIHSFADLSPDKLEYYRSVIRNKTALNYVRHIVDENERIKAASEGLHKCSINALVSQINMSEQSMEKLWNPDKQHVFLARKTMSIEGVLCARIWKNGIIALISDDDLDNAIRGITREFEAAAGYKPFICVADTFGD